MAAAKGWKADLERRWQEKTFGVRYDSGDEQSCYANNWKSEQTNKLVEAIRRLERELLLR